MTTIVRAVLASLLLCAALSGESLKVVEDRGHLSPLRVKITFVTGNIREALLVGIGRYDYHYTHVFGVVTEARTSPRRVWLDNIQSIRGTDRLRLITDEFTIVLKDGKEVQATFGNNMSCDASGSNLDDHFLCKFLVLQNEDDSFERVDLRTVEQLDFLGATRKDKLENSMFDHWQFSPFTGERLLR